MKNLILTAVGDNSLHKNWIEADNNFDLFLIYYGNEEDKFKADATYYVSRKGNKYLMFYDTIEQNKDIFEKYDNILIMDDDLYTETNHLNDFFKIFSENNFLLAQPSLLGYYTHEITLHDPKWIWRCTNFVEIMCPCFTKETLFKFKETFIENQIGWGIDWLWPKLLGYPKNKIAIIDDCIVLHTRPVTSGDFYKNNNISNGLETLHETIKKYNLSTKAECYYENSRWKNINCLESKDRFYPNLNCFKNYIDIIRKPKRIPFI